MAEYIDREAFKRKLIDDKNFFPSIVARALDEMPAADVVEAKHGEWVWKSNGYIKRLHCSCCNGEEDWPSTFCPKCGAKMDGERKEEK